MNPSLRSPASALVSALLAAFVLAACGKSSSVDASSGASTSTGADTVESLMRDPQRLHQLHLQCKFNYAKVGEELCNKVAQATRRRFLGNGMPYSPAPVPKSLWPAASASSAASAAKGASAVTAK